MTIASHANPAGPGNAANLGGAQRGAAHPIPGPSSRTLASGSPSAAQVGEPHPVTSPAPSVDVSGAYESVTRLMSETAHDLRAPLSTIREAIRLVRDGDLGKINAEQAECLSAAMNQCNCAAQLVDEMVQSRRFDSGFPNVRREWVLIDDVRQSVEETLQPWTMPRGIHLLWDGPYGQGLRIYADAALLRRLIVNLAGNAIRVTRDGGPVLIRAKIDRRSGEMVWSVVDQGQGIAPSDMELIAAGRAPAKSVGGLGLMISRQLAAAHFSTLRIESRLGTGTAVSFSTAIGGPATVVSKWVRWRSSLNAPTDSQFQSQRNRVTEVVPPSGRSVPTPPRQVRIDLPSQMVELGLSGVDPAFPHSVYLTTVSVGAAIPASGTDAFDQLLQRSLRFTEFAYRTGRRSWVIAWDADAQTGIRKRNDFEQLVNAEFDAMRMTWGHSNVVSISGERSRGMSLSTRLSDLTVRQTLAAAQQSVGDVDQVRLGTPPIAISTTAEARLEEAIDRLMS